jgi:hypothetical protein
LIELCEQFGDFYLAVQVKQSLAELLTTESHIAMAVRYLEEIHSWNLICRNKIDAKRTELFIGKLLFESQDFVQAKYWLKIASRVSRVESHWPIEIEAEIFLRLTEQSLNPRISRSKLDESLAKARALGMYELLDKLPEQAMSSRD